MGRPERSFWFASGGTDPLPALSAALADQPAGVALLVRRGVAGVTWERVLDWAAAPLDDVRQERFLEWVQAQEG